MCLNKWHMVLALLVVGFSVSFAEEDIEISRPEIDAQYYGLPLTIKGGYFYRKNDVSIFPNAGVSFAPMDIITGDVFSSFAVIYRNLKFESSFHYELFSSDMNEKDGKQIYYMQNMIEYGFNSGFLSFLTKYGKSRWNEYIKEGTGGLQILDTMNTGIRIGLFLFDTGLFRGNIESTVSYNFISDVKFNSYDIHTVLPITISLYHADIGIIYNNYYTGVLDFYRSGTGSDYVIEKKYSYITGRYRFIGNEPCYKLLNSLEIENRWYFLRGVSPASSFFVSVFGNIGLGIDRNDAPAFLGQYGMGFGYMLFDSVPFTFQAGFNTDGKPVFYTGVVSRINHF